MKTKLLDKTLLFPYFLSLKTRHAMFNSGMRKSQTAEVPTICIGNVAVGGTGKTPHTEMILRTLMADPRWKGTNISVLSRGYKRDSKGFQQVTVDGTAAMYGDEPLQIKKKFPFVTVAVDKDRNEGCRYLCHPDLLQTEKKARKCKDKNLNPASIIILDDAFQYRSLKPTVSIVLVDYNRPVFKDHLMPVGRLRDLPERLYEADIVIVTKCPAYMEQEEKDQWVRDLGLKENQKVFFTKIVYCDLEPVFPESESRYLYSKRLILFTGIADDKPLRMYLSDNYKVVRHLTFPDHHKYTDRDMMSVKAASAASPTAVIATTEKDSQRVKDCAKTPDSVKQRLFRAPIKVDFLSEEEHDEFRLTLQSFLK
ncbi:MAG: tetraacyldisaccharide 4'-kinase [Bacteroidales bacterium]|nr:tetraacyldisaccharide 4'-kinase [Candidatus Cryptobacteroides caccocaballi]